jgi:hypothetical protein
MSDRLSEAFGAATRHGVTFHKTLGLCLRVIQDRADAGHSHLRDIVTSLNFNGFYGAKEQ